MEHSSPSGLLLGDYLEILPSLAATSVDLVLADPPYGKTRCKWDSIISLDDMWVELLRILKPRGAVVLMAAQPFSSLLVFSNLKMFKYDWIWRKPKGTGHLNAKKQPLRDKEDVLVFYRKQPTYNPQMAPGKPYKGRAGKDAESKSSMTDSYGDYTNFRYNNPGHRYPKQVLEFPVVERNTLRPTQKPLELMEYLIKTYTNEGDRVLDFCMGSGTTGLACKNTQRSFIGIEKDPRYYAIAKKRIEDDVRERIGD